MSNFNKERFARYANWDLTINKPFYRNMALVMGIIILGIILVSFFCRWAIAAFSDEYMGGALPYELVTGLKITGIVIIIVIQYAICIAAGCVFHPLRNKQGRITDLTLSATNLEKYLWHLLICIVGCALVLVVSVAICDGINALLTYITFGGDYVQSLIGNVFTPSNIEYQKTIGPMFGNMDPANNMYENENEIQFNSFIYAAWINTIAGYIMQASIYTFGNSIKYKFNLPLTFIIYTLVENFIGITLFVTMIIVANSSADAADQFGRFVIEHMNLIFHFFTVCYLAIAAWLFIWAYKKFCKAQLVNSLNK